MKKVRRLPAEAAWRRARSEVLSEEGSVLKTNETSLLASVAFPWKSAKSVVGSFRKPSIDREGARPHWW